MNKKITISARIPCALEMEVNDQFEVVRVNRVTPVDVDPSSLNDCLDRDALDELDTLLAEMEDAADEDDQ